MAKEDPYFIGGRKVILDALKARKPLQKIYIQHGARGPEINTIEQLARKNRVPVVQMDKHKFQRLSRIDQHQGVLALIQFENIISQDRFLDQVLPDLKNRKNATIVYADRFNDPHNLGALIRTAELFSMDAVCFPQKEASPISPGVVKASMGAALQQTMVAVRTPYNFLSKLKDEGFTLIGAALRKDSVPLYEFRFPPLTCVIVGNEEGGIKHSLTRLMDTYIHIPQFGKTESFNASVAGGIILYEIIRQKTAP